MQRKENWATCLNEYLNEVMPHVSSTPSGGLQYGQMDCCVFAAGAVHAVTGFDPMKKFRGKYRSKSGANKVLKSLGEGNLFKTLVSIFGKPIAGSLMRRGDVAYYDGCCGVVIGREAVFLFDGGLLRVAITKIKKGFRVG